MLKKQLEVVGFNKKKKKGLTSTERWRKNKDKYNQSKKEKYWTDKNREEKLQKRREKYLFDKEKPLTKRKERGLIWKDCFNLQQCQELRVAPRGKIWKHSTNSPIAVALKERHEKYKREKGFGNHCIKIALDNLIPENLLKKVVKNKKVLATKKGRNVGDEKSPSYNLPYILIERGVIQDNSIKKRKKSGLTVGKENKVGLTERQRMFLEELMEMFNDGNVKVRVGVDKYGQVQYNTGWERAWTKTDIKDLLGGGVVNWKVRSEETGKDVWFKCNLAAVIKAGVKAKWRGKWYFLYINDFDFFKANIPHKCQRRFKINFDAFMNETGSWYVKTQHGYHHCILSETEWPKNISMLWEDKFKQHWICGDALPNGLAKSARFLGCPNKTIELNGCEQTIVKDFKEAQFLYLDRKNKFFIGLYTQEEIIKNKLKTKVFQKTQPVFKNKEKELNEPVLNNINENNAYSMDKILEYIQGQLKQQNSYIVKTQPQIRYSYSWKSRRRFQLMKIQHLLTGLEQWVYLPIFGYYGVSGKQKSNIYKGGLFNFALKQGHSLTFITNYTAC